MFQQDPLSDHFNGWLYFSILLTSSNYDVFINGEGCRAFDKALGGDEQNWLDARRRARDRQMSFLQLSAGNTIASNRGLVLV